MDLERIFSPICPLRGVVLVKDSLEADGTFLIPYTLRKALSNGYKVPHGSPLLSCPCT